MRFPWGLGVVAWLVACPGDGGDGSGGTPGTGSDPSSTPGDPTGGSPPTDGSDSDPGVTTGPSEPTLTGGPTSSPTSSPTSDTDPTTATETATDTDATDDTGPPNGDSHTIDPLPPPLIVWVDPGPGGKDPYLPIIKGPGGFAAHLQTSFTAEDLEEWSSRLQEGLSLVEDYGRCRDEGGGGEECMKKVVWAGLCNWAVGKLTERMSPAMQMIGFPFEAVCNGEPALKCCKYTGNDGCHSAYNSDMPINCEGNPMGGESFGPCISDDPTNIFVGCSCSYLPECSGGDAPVGDPKERAGRLDKAARKLAEELAGLAADDLPGFYNFATLYGTRDHLAALAELAPFAGPDELPMNPNLDAHADYHVNDDDPPSRALRAMTTTAVRRVIGGLPNSLDRWDHVLAKEWDDASKAAYLAGVADPEGEVLAALGPFGLAMVKAAYPDTFMLLGAPTPNEAPDPDAGLYLAGVEQAAPPVLAFSTTAVDGPEVTLTLSLDDAQAVDNTDGRYLVAVDWGDNVWQGLVVDINDPTSLQAKHAYASPGVHAVRMWTSNTAGLIAGAGGDIEVAVGTNTPNPRSIESVTLVLRAEVTASTHGHFSVAATGVDAGAFTHPIGRAWVLAAGAADTPVAIDFPAYAMQHRDRVPLPTLKLRATHAGAANVQSASVLLEGVRVAYYTSEGQTPSTVTYTAAELSAAIAGDPPTPIAAMNGAFALPIDADVEVTVPTP